MNYSPGSSSMGFFRQEYWSRLPFPLTGDLPRPGIQCMSPMSPALQTDSLLLSPPGKPMTSPENIFKSRDITLITKVHSVKTMVFPLVMYRYVSWIVKKAEC